MSHMIAPPPTTDADAEAGAGGDAEQADVVAPRVHKGDGWAIAAPADWRLFPEAPRPMVLYLIGDGRAGVPLMDGTLSAMKAGITVERFPAGEESLKAFAEKDVKQLDNARRFKVTSKPAFEDVTLADGTEARLMKAEFLRLDNRRQSIHRKLYCVDAQGRRLVATGFVTCSPPGAGFVEAVGLTDFFEAHLKSLVLDAGKLDVERLKPAYEKLNPNVAAALERTGAGNDLLEEKKYAEAAAAFREALAKSGLVSAAHNGLAWSLLHAADPPRPPDVKEAIKAAARAVELTDELDYTALDTLALALHRNGDKDKALNAVRRALELQPGHPELEARLKSIRGDK